MTANFAKNLPHAHARQAEASTLAATAFQPSRPLVSSTARSSWRVLSVNFRRFESGSQENRRRSEFQLIGFPFVDRDDLEIVAGCFQNKRFVDLAGRMFATVA
jgi:hypothetical protein